MPSQLATWLDKKETSDNKHRITVVRDVDEEEVRRVHEAIRVVHAYIVREPFVLVVQNHMEYKSFHEHVADRVRNDPLPLLQDDAHELGAGLRFRFLNWLLSLKAFLDLMQADLNRRFGRGSSEAAAFEQAQKNEFDGNFGYRLMSRLRNFGQHAAFPPLDGRIDILADDSGSSERILELFLDRDKLLEWDGWTIVRAELEAKDPEIAVTEHMEAAMESLTNIAAAVKRIDLPTLLDAAHLLNDLWEETTASPGVPLIVLLDGDDEGALRWLWVPKLDITPGH